MVTTRAGVSNPICFRQKARSYLVQMLDKFRVLVSDMLFNECCRLEKLLALFASELSLVLLFDMRLCCLRKLPIVM